TAAPTPAIDPLPLHDALPILVGKDPGTNTVWVDQGDSPLLYSTVLEAGQLSWVAGDPPAQRFECTARTRYRQPDQVCTVTLTGEDRKSTRLNSSHVKISYAVF